MSVELPLVSIIIPCYTRRGVRRRSDSLEPLQSLAARDRDPHPGHTRRPPWLLAEPSGLRARLVHELDAEVLPRRSPGGVGSWGLLRHCNLTSIDARSH